MCEANVAREVLATRGLAEDECRAMSAVESAIGMAEIHVGTADGVERVVFPLPVVLRTVAAHHLRDARRGVPERVCIPDLKTFQKGVPAFAAALSATEQRGGLRTGARPAGRPR